MNKGSDIKAIVFSAYYEPEVAASLYLSTNLYEDMAGSGIDVDLFVPLPTRGVSDEVCMGVWRKVCHVCVTFNDSW